MVLLDARRRVVEINDAFLQLLGYRRDAIVSHPIYEFIVGGPIASEAEWTAALREERPKAGGGNHSRTLSRSSVDRRGRRFQSRTQGYESPGEAEDVPALGGRNSGAEPKLARCCF